MKQVRTTNWLRVIFGLVLLMLVPSVVLAGCGGGDGDVNGSMAQILDNSSIVTIDSGGFIEVPEGALPENAQVTIQATQTPVI